jgi:cation diffusion facilitator family transporter
MSTGANSRTSILYALGANAAIALTKGAGAAYTGSASMLAEAIHSVADCANQGLLLWGLREARRAASPEHPLGHGRAVYFWSFLVALMLFSVGGVFSIAEGIRKWQSPQPVSDAWIAIAILAFGVIAESISLWGALREIRKDRGTRSLWRWFRTTRQSELLVVLGEDIAALGGLTIALAFITIAWATGDPRWDAAGSIGIGVLLVCVALLVAFEVKALLVGSSTDAETEAGIRACLIEQPEVSSVYSLLTQQLGADVMVAVKAQMRREPSDVALIEAINRVEGALRERFPQIRWLFFEPDVRA